ncbi:GGDEF domain-containing protein [Planosporangium thailandense]|uniref:GGDEF domain-containing protein n=1 Tax=Planosporangium thailandense TaxID=765197 RepID=A0ABX0Y409_9ACTN|nr:GGDEF domain-containing protein [Planosporangium thailandense]NJC73131.1 GGDEF domain-containing protein [Planosporangium thailandense]
MTTSELPARDATTVAGPSMLSGWRRPPAWAGFIASVVVLAGVYYLVPLAGPVGASLQTITYGVVVCGSVAAFLLGVRRHRPPARTPWLVIAAGQAFTAAGEITYDVIHLLLHSDASVTAADPLLLAAFPVQAVGLMLMVRRRTPGWDAPSIIDATIITVSAALLSWIYLISPSALATDLTPLDRAAAVAYPLGDLLLLAVAARLVLGAGVRTTAFWLLSAGLAASLLTDTVYGVQTLLGTYFDGSWTDAGWMLCYALMGASGLHASMTRVAEPSPAAGPDATAGRLLVLAVAAVLAPTAELVQYLRHAPTFLPLVTTGCIALFLLVIARMAVLIQAQRHMAITDALTGLRTRRFLQQALDTETARARRQNASLGLLLLDVDHFKHVNDTHGHHGGDRVLCEVAHRLKAVVRPGDIVARYGGEEFAVLLPQVNDADLADVAERIRRCMANTPMAVDAQTLINVTVSVGGALLPDHVDTPDDLTLATDRALYAAKEAGRNRTVTAAPIASRA